MILPRRSGRILNTHGFTTFTYDADDRNGSSAYTYNANGDVLNDGTHTYSYDFEDHLIGSGTQTTQTATYAYDADGTRVQKIDSTGTVNYLVDSNRIYAEVLEERDASGNVLARYDYGDDLIRMDRGSNTRYYLFDGLGSTRQLTDGTGAVTDTYAYDAFGNLTSQTGNTVNPYLFNGQEQDAGTGLYYLRARYMNPQDGRFISQDPFGGDDEDPISLHRYLYSSANPVNVIDPSGEDGIVDTALSVSIVTTLSASVFGVYGAILFSSTNGNGYVGAVVGSELGASLALAYFSDRLPVALFSALMTSLGSLIVDLIVGKIDGKFNSPGSEEYNQYYDVIYEHLLEAAASGAADVAFGSFKHQTSEIKAYIAAGTIALQDFVDDLNSFPDAKDKSALLEFDTAQIAVDAFFAGASTYYISAYLGRVGPSEAKILRQILQHPSPEEIKEAEEEVEITIEGLAGIVSGTGVGAFFNNLKDTAIKGF